VQAQGCGNAVVIDHGGNWISGYCHLARGSLKVKVGDQVKVGQPLARVGLSGLTEFPHLHFSVVHGNARIDPFAPTPAGGGSCKPQPSLWTPAAAKSMAYKTGVVLNAGFAGQAVTVEALDAGGVPPPNSASPYVTAYVRVLNLQKADVSQLVIKGPDGAELVSQKLDPLAKDRAVEFMMIGKKRPAQGWARGVYAATYRVYRQGKVAVSKDLALRL
jgi:murein DD-endopeptidase MepM/ murein hydrolase activator NlpD